jgi:hypothetical protein
LPIATFYGLNAKTSNLSPLLSTQPSTAQLNETVYNNRYTELNNSNEKQEQILKEK